MEDGGLDFGPILLVALKPDLHSVQSLRIDGLWVAGLIRRCFPRERTAQKVLGP